MSRIRTIKPEFCVSEQLAECSPSARLVFALMWMFCDDQGIHPAKPKKLRGEVFPLDDEITTPLVATWVSELISVKLLREYEVNGEKFWLVTGWDKHQKIDKPTRRYPLPLSEDSPSIPVVLAERSPPEGKGREGKGVEGKGESKNPQQAAAVITQPPPGIERIAALRSLCVQNRVACESTKANMHLGQWANEGLTDEQLLEAIRITRHERGKPDPAVIQLTYLVGIVSDLRNGIVKSREPQQTPAEINAAVRTSTEAKMNAKLKAAVEANGHQLEEGEFVWWMDSDAIILRAAEEGVVNVAGQPFEEFTARVFAAAGPGPWLDEADAELLAKVEHYQAVGVNPPVAASTRYEPVPAGR